MKILGPMLIRNLLCDLGDHSISEKRRQDAVGCSGRSKLQSCCQEVRSTALLMSEGFSTATSALLDIAESAASLPVLLHTFCSIHSDHLKSSPDFGLFKCRSCISGRQRLRRSPSVCRACSNAAIAEQANE